MSPLFSPLFRFLGCYLQCTSTYLFGCLHLSTNTTDRLFFKLCYVYFGSFGQWNFRFCWWYPIGVQITESELQKVPTYTYILYFIHSNKYTSVLPMIFVTYRTELCWFSMCDLYSTSVQLTLQQISTDFGSHIVDRIFRFDSCFWIINWQTAQSFSQFFNVRLIPVIFYRSNGQRALQTCLAIFFFEIRNTWCTTEINWEYFITTKKRAHMTVQYRNKFWSRFLNTLCEILLIPFYITHQLEKFILTQPPPFRLSRVWSRVEDIWLRVILLNNTNSSMT